MALGFFVGNRVTVARVCGGVVPNCITECRPVTNLLARLCLPKKEERIVVRVVALTIGSKEGGGCEVENLSIICSVSGCLPRYHIRFAQRTITWSPLFFYVNDDD